MAIYNDGDLRKYRFNDSIPAHLKGYPLGLLFIQSLYSWNIGSPLEDVIVIRYTIINTSRDTLRDCWFGPALDIHLYDLREADWFVTMDQVRHFSERPDLQTAMGWTAGTSPYPESPFGTLAVSLLETPTVNAAGWMRNDKKSYGFSE
ncbi:MAG TPA: hypothetical protein VEC36_11395 [Patescibacteria group bacterium]|nr:hypothetical protein [Patescibacteria group bacterium]